MADETKPQERSREEIQKEIDAEARRLEMVLEMFPRRLASHPKVVEARDLIAAAKGKP